MRRRWAARAANAAAVAIAVTLVAAGCSGSDKGGHAAVAPGEATGNSTPPGAGCTWPMWGQNASRTFSYPCPTTISPTSVKDLKQKWFFNTADVVTATPAVVDGVLYVGDWSGAFYALDARSGAKRWTFQADVAPNVYAGQIVSSAAVTTSGSRSLVIFADGPTVYALNTTDGSVAWKTNIGTGGADDFTEFESSPVVVEGKVILGSDVHNHPGQRAGVFAFDVDDGKQLWYYDTDDGQPASGCVDVWGSAAVDLERRTVYVGTGSCDTATLQWRPNSEALVAIDLDKGTKRWAYQPHDKSAADLDFAGAPNLFDAAGKALVGLGNKDGTYYALDRESGKLVWKREVTKGGPTGGFIGPTVYARGVIAGGTAVGEAPFLHALNATDGSILWQQPKAQATYAASAEANGVVFSGGTDFTMRAVDLKSGDVLWSHQVAGVVAGGAAIVGEDVFTVAGLRDPGTTKAAGTSGVYRFSLAGDTVSDAGTTAAPTTTAPPVGSVTLTNGDQRCVGSPCPLSFLKPKPDGVANPSATLEITTSPFSLTVKAANLGDPGQWVTPGSDAAAVGATQFGVFISESDETLRGGLVCVLDADLTCTGTTLPFITTYTRVTLLAVKDTSSFPSPADGLARLVATTQPSLEPPLEPKPA